MFKLLTSLLIFILFIFQLSTKINATTSPTSTANNKYGIHITDESDIKLAAELVNSSGGDWGYVTFVIRTDERDTKRWQNFFNELRRNHLIPIVRIASKITSDGWEKLNPDEIDGWVSFLNSLNWVVQNRYVIVGNEVNLGHEWGGKANPQEYSNYLQQFTNKLKSQSTNFFIMAAALDPNAEASFENLSENEYLSQMHSFDKNIFNNLDGLASHSYPYKQLGVGSDFGTLKHFEWELNILRTLGTSKDLPVFITETGWKHGSGYFDQNSISKSLKDTIESVWTNEKVVAITPFVLDYNSPPFENYSWIDKKGNKYDYFYTYKNSAKISGKPIQHQSAEVVSYILPRLIRTKFGNVYGFFYIRNTGQTIWKGYHPITLIINGIKTQIKPITILSDVEPGGKTLAVYSVK